MRCFLQIGMDPKRMRFRQHLSTEMAHYAADCWDMEIQVSDGWTECVGHADRYVEGAAAVGSSRVFFGGGAGIVCFFSGEGEPNVFFSFLAVRGGVCRRWK